MQDDIDWMSASSDLGLVQLCREMAALARPVEAILKRPAQRVRRTRRIAAQRVRVT
ncbi:hypothetical protein [Vitreimonas sp.]|uniref:hypothetical protein n=1 Tax=Vitreimonas sp. TaxID=3069702 RepID=UPI002ED9F062